MTTTKSFSSGGSRTRNAYWSALPRQLPFLIATSIILTIILVIPYVVAPPSHLDYTWRIFASTAEVKNFYLEIFQYGVYLSPGQSGLIAFGLFVLSMACALVSNRYLHSKTMTDLYHALPIRRAQLMLSNLLASLTAILAPYTLLYFGTAAGQYLMYGRYECFGLRHLQYIASDYLLTVLFVAVVYLFTTFVCINIGTTFDALALTMAMGYLPSVVFLIAGFVWSYASGYGHGDYPYDLTLLLSPLLFYFDRYRHHSYTWTESGDDPNALFRVLAVDYQGLALTLLIWIALGALLYAATVFCYKRRRSELAGQIQPYGVLQSICKCLAVYVGAAFFLAFFSRYGLIGQLIGMLIGGLSFGVIAELIESRGVRYLRRNILLVAGFSVLCCIVYALLRF